MIDRATATDWLRTVAEDELDDELAALGFGRRPTTTVYRRKVPDGDQKIRLYLQVRPRYAPDSFHLTMKAELAYPRLWRVRADMLDHDPLLVGKSGVVHGEPLDSIGANPRMLLFQDKEGLRFLAPRIARHVREDIVPYLDDRNSIENLVARMAQNLAAGVTPTALGSAAIAGPWPVTVAAGQIVLGQKEKARITLDRYYPDGSKERVRYRRAFTVVAGE